MIRAVHVLVDARLALQSIHNQSYLAYYSSRNTRSASPSSPSVMVQQTPAALPINYNDPLVGGKSFPGGWFGGFYACEVLLQLPYFLWALTVPIGIPCSISQLRRRR